MLKKNCHLVFGFQKSKLTLLELVFQTAGAINPPPPPTKIGLRLKIRKRIWANHILHITYNTYLTKHIKIDYKLKLGNGRRIWTKWLYGCRSQTLRCQQLDGRLDVLLGDLVSEHVTFVFLVNILHLS